MIIKKDIIKKFQTHKKDCGSIYLQIALLSSQINNLSEHLKKNKKDFTCKKNLIFKVHKRSKFLKYLKKNNFKQYEDIKDKLKLRK